MPQLLDKKDIDPKVVEKPFEADTEEKKIIDFLKKRVPVLKDSKKRILGTTNFEEIMKEADKEYLPNSLSEKKDTSGNVMLVQDEIKGLRGSRVVPITGKEGTEWRSNVSEPTLLVKVQTALSILVDQNPEAVFKALLDKYKPTSAMAKAIWQRSWGVAKSKEQLKLFIFDLAKYGWAIGRTYPRLVQRTGEILTELDTANPEKNKYKKVTITEFNDIYREKMDPYRAWIDDKTNLTDPWSMDDWYFEIDVARDDFDRDFGQYANSVFVKFGQKKSESKEEDPVNEETKQRDDIVTLGFYEGKNKDLYGIWVPDQNIIVYSSPLPNDDKMLSCWWAYWVERDPRTPYGIGLFEIIKNNKVLYDRLDNMDIDSLVLAIYTMLFYSGSNSMVGDGHTTVSPGVMKQKLPGTTVEQMKFDYTGKGREGAKQQTERIDEITGITPTLQGQVEGKTLGEVLHAKDAALKRLNIPLSNVASALEVDAYLTLSWASQIYSLPEVMEFADQKEMDDFNAENGREASGYQTGGTPEAPGPITADYPRVLDLSLEKNREGVLIESPENRFFAVGKDVQKSEIRWKGKITISPQSIIAPSQELDRQRKMELFNLVTPVVQAITTMMAMGQIKSALAMAKPVVQILEIQNEEPEKWLPDEVVKLLANPAAADQMEQAHQAAAAGAQNAAKPLFVDQNGQGAGTGGPAAPGGPQTQPGATPAPMPVAPSSQGGDTPGVVPKDQITNPLKKSVSELGKAR